MASNHPAFGNYAVVAANTWEQLPHRVSATDGIVLKARAANAAAIQLASSATPAAADIAQVDAGEAVVLPIMSVDRVWVRSTSLGVILDIFASSSY